MWIQKCAWCLLDRASLWQPKNKKPTRCHLLFLFYFLQTQRVSGINMPIVRSLRLCCWTTTLVVSFLVCCVLELGCGSARVVSGLPAARIPGNCEFEFHRGHGCLCCECCVLLGRGLCNELITRPEESYRLWCVVVRDLETSWMRRPWSTVGCRARKKQTRLHRTTLLITSNSWTTNDSRPNGSSHALSSVRSYFLYESSFDLSRLFQNIRTPSHFVTIFVCILLGISPASDCSMPTFRNTLSVPPS